MKNQEPEYGSWTNMLTRCRNPNGAQYADYGGRGIRVCERWLVFENFLEDVGRRPSPAHSLDRIDNDGDYAPGNVQWATRAEQAANKRNNRRITAHGETLHLEEWTRRTGLHRQTILWRLRNGWAPDRALTVDDHRKYVVRTRDAKGKFQ